MESLVCSHNYNRTQTARRPQAAGKSFSMQHSSCSCARCTMSQVDVYVPYAQQCRWMEMSPMLSVTAGAAEGFIEGCCWFARGLLPLHFIVILQRKGLRGHA